MVAHQGRIYVGGGFGQDKAILCSVECYDPDTDKVGHLLSQGHHPHSLFSVDKAAAHEEDLWVCRRSSGGQAGPSGH